ncbi:hypothetical protein BGX34_001188, partial [Mortierella sp. NVP85]
MSALGVKRRKSLPHPSGTAPPLSPLNIPEILEITLRCLTNSQIRYGPTYVCKAWHSSSLRILDDTATWNNDMVLPDDSTPTITATSPTLFEQQLLTATSLKVHLKSPFGGHVSQVPATTIQSLPKETLQRIRTLYYLDDVYEFSRHFNLDTFKPLQHLTTLYAITKTHYCYNLDELFLAFPNLKVLNLGQNLPFLGYARTKLMRLDQEEPFPATVEKLRSLTLKAVQVEGTLDQLLSQCPRLKELKL